MPLDFAPDLSRLTPGNLYRVVGFAPTVNRTYTPAPGPLVEAYSTPVSSTDVIGSAVVKNASGSALLYAGTTTKLLQANGTTGWTDRSGTTYAASSTGTWSFAQYGDTTLAANGSDKIQKATGGAFSDLSSDAPSAKIITIHENAGLAYSGETWYRSDTGDVTTWTANAANDADSGPLRGGGTGPVTAATVFGPLAIAWKQNAMYSGVFTAGTGGTADPKIRWDFVPGGLGIGCIGQNAHINTDIGLIFVSDRDIMVFDGGRPRSIAGKVRRYFFQNAVSKSQIFITHNEVERNIFIWFAVTGTYPALALVFNYESMMWGELDYISLFASTTFDYARCPVRNANYTDYIAVGGTATNTGLECNAVWLSPHDGTGAKLVNFAASKQAVPSGGPQMTTWLAGEPLKDTTFSKIVQVGPGTNTTPTISTVEGHAYYGANGTASTTWTGAVGADSHGNMAVTSRYIDSNLTWTQSGTVHEIVDLIFMNADGQAITGNAGKR